MGVFQAEWRGAETGVWGGLLGEGHGMSEDRAGPAQGGLQGLSVAGVLGLLLEEPWRSRLNSGSIFIFPSRELSAVPLCPVDKEVIKSHEVRKSLLWFSSSLGDREASVLTGHQGWSRSVGWGGRGGGDLPWSPCSSAEGSGQTLLLPLLREACLGLY